MQKIENFAFDESLVRVIVRHGDPWFVGVDVCKALSLVKPENALATLDDDEKYTLTEGVISGTRGPDARVVVSEPGVYRLVFRSRKPEAERFKRWLAHEVLPAIRKAGFYSTKGVANADKPEPDLAPDPASERLLYKLGLVREARLLFGPERARGLWRQLGLPAVPPAPPTARDEARVCLRHLLEAPVCGGGPAIGRLIEEALEDDEEARLSLLSAGVRVLQESDGFVVANRNQRLAEIFEGTEWGDGRWARVLRRLPGTQGYRPVAFGASKRGGRDLRTRGTYVPADNLDHQSVPALAIH